MAQKTICITNTITLVPGGIFVLPPGSEIIGTSDVSSIQSVCADLTKIEQSVCYILSFGGFNNAQAGATQYSDNSAQFIRGYVYNGNYVEFANPIINNNINGSFDMNVLRDNLVKAFPAIIGTTVGYKLDSNGSRQNSMSILAIKTYPSIANNLQIRTNNDAPLNSTGGAIDYRTPLIPRADFVAQGYLDLPDCP